jgi:NAD-dependent deacetylase
MLNLDVIHEATQVIGQCDLFISVGTSGAVWPAAGFPRDAKEHGARCIEINPEANDMSSIYDENIREAAGNALVKLFE